MNRLEPGCEWEADATHPKQRDYKAALSSALSMKRIADALEALVKASSGPDTLKLIARMMTAPPEKATVSVADVVAAKKEAVADGVKNYQTAAATAALVDELRAAEREFNVNPDARATNRYARAMMAIRGR